MNYSSTKLSSHVSNKNDNDNIENQKTRPVSFRLISLHLLIPAGKRKQTTVPRLNTLHARCLPLHFLPFAVDSRDFTAAEEEVERLMFGQHEEDDAVSNNTGGTHAPPSLLACLPACCRASPVCLQPPVPVPTLPCTPA